MQHLGVGNCRQYFLNHEEFRNGNTAEYQDYLEQLSKDFANDVKHLVKQGLNKQRKGKSYTVYNEVLHHAHLCNSHLNHFQGQKELLFAAEKFLKDPRRNFRPFVVHGDIGSGKSSAMAKVASLVKSWLAQDCVVVTRFLGTSLNSSSIYQTLISITQQICCAYGLKLPQRNMEMNTLYDTILTFRNVVEHVSEKLAGIRPLVLVLDGVDQLLPIEESMKAMWAICQIPSNVHIIISMVTQLGELNLVEMLSSMVTDIDSVQRVEPFSQSDVKNLIDSLATEMNMKILEDSKTNLIESSILLENLSDPLYIYHYVRIALTNFPKDVDASNPSEILAGTLEEMEEKYHPSLIEYVASYLTINPLGIQERELLDLLNSDTSLINSILQEDDSLITDSGISAFIWAKVKLDLGCFLRNNIVCGKVVLAWNQRTWFATAANMYGVIFPGIDQNRVDTASTTFTLKLHENMARLYLRHRDESASVSPNFPQPTEEHNTMKLVKLPTHMHVLLPIEGLQRIKSCIFFNLEWLFAKVKAFSVRDILHDLQSVINLAKLVGDDVDADSGEHTFEDLQAMYEFLQLAEESLQLNPDNLLAQAMARLPPLLRKYRAMDNLLSSVHEFISKTVSPYLMPIYPCLKHPNSPLRHNLNGPTHVIGLIQEDTLALLFSQQTGVGIWKLETGELIHHFPTNAEQSPHGVLSTKSGEYVLIGHYSHLNHVMNLEVFSVATGIPVVKAQFPQKFEIMKLDTCDEVLLVSTCMEVTGQNKELQRCLLGIDIKSKEIAYTIPVTANNVHNHGISEMMFLQDSLHILTVGNKLSKDLACWNLESQELLWKINLDHHPQYVKATDDDKLVVENPENGVLTVISSESGETLATASNESVTEAEAMYVSKHGKHLLMGSATAGIRVMDLETAVICKSVDPPDLPTNDVGKVTQITMDALEQFVFMGYSTGIIDVFSIATEDFVTRLTGHRTTVVSLMSAEHDFKLLSTSQDGRCCVWNIRSFAEEYCQKTGENYPHRLLFT